MCSRVVAVWVGLRLSAVRPRQLFFPRRLVAAQPLPHSTFSLRQRASGTMSERNESQQGERVPEGDDPFLHLPLAKRSLIEFTLQVLEFVSEAGQDRFVEQLRQFRAGIYANNTARRDALRNVTLARDPSIPMAFPFSFWGLGTRPTSPLKRLAMTGRPSLQWKYLVGKLKKYILQVDWTYLAGANSNRTGFVDHLSLAIDNTRRRGQPYVDTRSIIPIGNSENSRERMRVADSLLASEGMHSGPRRNVARMVLSEASFSRPEPNVDEGTIIHAPPISVSTLGGSTPAESPQRSAATAP